MSSRSSSTFTKCVLSPLSKSHIFTVFKSRLETQICDYETHSFSEEQKPLSKNRFEHSKVSLYFTFYTLKSEQSNAFSELTDYLNEGWLVVVDISNNRVRVVYLHSSLSCLLSLLFLCKSRRERSKLEWIERSLIYDKFKSPIGVIANKKRNRPWGVEECLKVSSKNFTF